ncbi:reverse transcriptase [Aphelenchoides avenae]|nr:reverse transcriptase [Aphelenchus avenae]
MKDKRCCSNKLRFATFNCGQSGIGGTDSMNPNGYRTCELMEALERIKFDIVGLSETHSREERHSKWKVGELRGSELHIGAADGHVGGIGFIVNAKLSARIHSVDVSSSRVGVLKIKLGRRHLLTVIQCYAPHSGYEDQEVEAFYAEVERHLSARRGPVVVMGDFNARVGPREPDELYIGGHSAELRNDAGIRLAAFAEAQQLSPSPRDGRGSRQI